MDARSILYRHLHEFFDRYLAGKFQWSEIEHMAAELAVIPEGKTRNPLGKFKEVVHVRFGIFDLEIASPEETPPLGRVTLQSPDGKIEGPPDSELWKQIAAAIARQHEVKENVA